MNPRTPAEGSSQDAERAQAASGDSAAVAVATGSPQEHAKSLPLLAPTVGAVAGYLEHKRRCLLDPATMRAQSQKHFQIYAQEQKTIGLNEITLSWSRLLFRLGLPYERDALQTLLELLQKHTSPGMPHMPFSGPSRAVTEMRVDQDAFELIFVKMLQFLKPPLLVRADGEPVGAEGSEREEYRKRLQRCLLDHEQLQAQALKHFQAFSSQHGSSQQPSMGLPEVTRSLYQMHARMGMETRVEQLERIAGDLLTNYSTGLEVRLTQEAWELLYWKMLTSTFKKQLPLKAPDGSSNDGAVSAEPAEEQTQGLQATEAPKLQDGANMMHAPLGFALMPMPGGMQMPMAMPMPVAPAGACVPPGMVQPQAQPQQQMQQPMQHQQQHAAVAWPVMASPQMVAPQMLGPGAPTMHNVNVRAQQQSPLPVSLDGGRFLVEMRLGTGSFGEVFKAKVAASGQLVAVKRVLKQREAMSKEFMVLRNLNHPNVLRVTHHFEDESSLYVVSEFLSGGSITDLMSQQNMPLSEAWASEVLGQTLAATAYFHGEGVVHNDLKPENLLLKSSSTNTLPHVVVSDFGQASAVLLPNQCPVTELPLGDPRYMPPEAWDVQTCHGVCSKPGDIWMIATTLFEILAGGALPFLGRKHVTLQEFKKWCATVRGFSVKWVQCLKTGDVMWQNLYEPQRSQSAMSLLNMMLAKNPMHRPDCLQALEHPWFWEHRPLAQQGASAPDAYAPETQPPEASCFSEHEGFLVKAEVEHTTAGEKLTIEEAKAKCIKTHGCAGFTVNKKTGLVYFRTTWGEPRWSSMWVSYKYEGADRSALSSSHGQRSTPAAGAKKAAAPAPAPKAKAAAAASAPASPATDASGRAVPSSKGASQKGGKPVQAANSHKKPEEAYAKAHAKSSAPAAREADQAPQQQQQQQQQPPPAESHVEELLACLDQERSQEVPSMEARPSDIGMPSTTLWLPPGTWRRYREPGTNRLWFYKKATEEFFFADDLKSNWCQFTHINGQIWWWNWETSASFFEDDCDSIGNGEVDLHSLGLEHLRKEVRMPSGDYAGEVSTSSLKYTGKAWEFQVVLDRASTDDKFGIVFSVVPGSLVPVVSQVKPTGMCARHNSEVRQFHEDSMLHQTQVVPGDQVKVVNGFTSVDDIKNELMSSLVVHLRVRRPANAPEESRVPALQ